MATEKKSSAPVTAGPQVPSQFASYEDKTEDMVGYWDEDSGIPVHCIPLYAVLFDNKVEPRNASILIFAKLLDPCKLLKKEDDKKTSFDGVPGDQIGIFAKPGMRRIGKLADCKTLVMRDPTRDKDVGKPEKMKYFKVLNAPGITEKPLIVMDDRRKQSFERSTFLDKRKRPKSDTNGDGDTSDYGF